jgi:hypothetical protein
MIFQYLHKLYPDNYNLKKILLDCSLAKIILKGLFCLLFSTMDGTQSLMLAR